MNLSANELRVIGCLIEKEATTPDQYPLSLNALVSACNQKSNREPVLDLDELTVQQTLDELNKRRLIREESGFGSRVVKYKHRFCNTEFSELKLSQRELGVVCVMFLRGPQTPGELRTRTNRLCHFDDIHQVEQTLADLSEHPEGPFVIRLPKEPGKRESRFAHLFGSQKEVCDFVVVGAATSLNPVASGDAQQVDSLQQQIDELRQQLLELQQRVDELTG